MTTRAAMRAERDGAVLVATLDRPDLLNRLDLAAHDELTALLLALASPGDVRCLVLAANGKAFSAGGDVQEVFALQADAQRRQEMFERGRALFHALIGLACPLVVAMQGDAHGLGATIALTADAIVASRNVRISDAHVRVGLAAGDGGCVVWPQAIGMLRARRHLLTGDAVTAEAALAMGLITDLVEQPHQVLPAALALAARIAALPPLAVQGTKRALNLVLARRADEVFEQGLAIEAETMASADVLEAVNAFMQKRLPLFSGR